METIKVKLVFSLVVISVLSASVIGSLNAEEKSDEKKQQQQQQKETDLSALEEKLEALNMPGNRPPQAVNTDKLYSFQTRYSPLGNRHELALDLGKNLTINGLLRSHQVGGTYRYHFSDKWAVLLTGSKVFNELSPSGELLLSRDDILPDKDYMRYQAGAAVEYNLFYGKFRLSMDQVFYFDQYWSLGAGAVGLRSGTTNVVNLDGGLAFWLGKRGSVRLGLKNDFYQEQTLSGKDFNHNLVAYFSVGYFFGSVEK